MSPPKAARRASLTFIALSLCLDYLAQSIHFPLLPRLTQELMGGDLASTARWVGLLEVAWALPMFFAAPVLGMLSDRFGRRPVIVISVFAIGLELVMSALAPNIWWLVAGRILCGFTCGGTAAAMAYVADITPPEGRTRAYGLMNAAVYTGIIAGPALGGLLSGYDLRLPFWVAAGFALLNGLYGLFVLPESLPKESRSPLTRQGTSPWGAVGLIRQAGLIPMAAALLCIWLAFQAKDNMIVLYTAQRYGWTPVAFGIFASALAISHIAVQAGLAETLSKRLGDPTMVRLGLGLQVAGLVAMGLASSPVVFWLSNIPLILGALATPALQSLMTARVEVGEQGRLQGAIGSISSLTGIVGPIAFSQVFAWSLAQGPDPDLSGLTILIGAGFSLLALVLFLRTRAQPQA